MSVASEIDVSATTGTAADLGYPLRLDKIQRPALPDDTLRRDRLLEWLEARTNSRVVLVVSEAGFGKTTLVADFARRSHLRTFWYRLDEEDANALTFLRYVVSSLQLADPALAPRCSAMLAEAAICPADPEAILQTLLWELDRLTGQPCVLVLDDLHVVDSVPAIRSVVERLIGRAPRILRFILISRRVPSLAVAALRVRNDLVQIGRDDLRFDITEVRRLFSESCHHPLETDVLCSLQARTEGWAASLQLVKTAVSRLSPAQVRSFVDSLSGADGDLYDYLAEEVVGELPPELRGFLMRAALLEEINPQTASVVVGVPASTAGRLMADAERLGLLSRGGGAASTWRAHPLVRDYLLARLRAELGESGIVELHRRAAIGLESRSWALAARHWAAAGDGNEVRRVICTAVPAIIAAGDLAAACEFMSHFPSQDPNPWYDILRSRQLVEVGRHEEAEILARRAAQYGLEVDPDDHALGTASALNLLYLSLQTCKREIGSHATDYLRGSSDDEMASIARATQSLQESGETGSCDDARHRLLETLQLNRDRGHHRYEAITLLNLSVLERTLGNPEAAIAAAEMSMRLLDMSGNPMDMAAVRLNMAKALADLGQWEQAQTQIWSVLDGEPDWVEPGNIAEAAELHAIYGDPTLGCQMLSKAVESMQGFQDDPFSALVSARLELHSGRVAEAADVLSRIEGVPVLAPGFSSAQRALDVQIRATLNPTDSSLRERLRSAANFAKGQQAWFSWKSVLLTEALISPIETLADHLRSMGPRDRALLSIHAELILGRLSDLDGQMFRSVKEEARLRPDRWRGPLRRLLTDPDSCRPAVKRAAELLDLVGKAEDVALLRRLATCRTLGTAEAGRTLIRRLAPTAYVEDLGRVRIRIGDRVVAGTHVRKKVLSLLGYLITRPQYAATREQALEALWPEMDPVAGANSLNQTVYFLRRVFEEDYDEDESAGYLNSRADLVWLDSSLVGSRSSDCLSLIAALRRDSQPAMVASLTDAYTARFAMDFIYDDWASAFRDTLHAAFLDRVENAIRLDTSAENYDRAISIAQRVIQTDPDAEQIELALLRLYRRVGAHAAASEQYGHYVSVMRDQLGLEAPPLEAL